MANTILLHLNGFGNVLSSVEPRSLSLSLSLSRTHSISKSFFFSLKKFNSNFFIQIRSLLMKTRSFSLNLKICNLWQKSVLTMRDERGMRHSDKALPWARNRPYKEFFSIILCCTQFKALWLVVKIFQPIRILQNHCSIDLRGKILFRIGPSSCPGSTASHGRIFKHKHSFYVLASQCWHNDLLAIKDTPHAVSQMDRTFFNLWPFTKI